MKPRERAGGQSPYARGNVARARIRVARASDGGRAHLRQPAAAAADTHARAYVYTPCARRLNHAPQRCGSSLGLVSRPPTTMASPPPLSSQREQQQRQEGETQALAEQAERAKELAASHPGETETLFRSVLASSSGADSAPLDDAAIKAKESAVYGLTELLAEQARAQDIGELSRTLRPFFGVIAKAKTAKIVRVLLDAVSRCSARSGGGTAAADDAVVDEVVELQIQLCRDIVDWCRTEKRTFLRQRIETKLAGLYLDVRRYQDALALTNELLREVKRLDDKAQLLEVQLLESRIHHALRNVPKARAALTAARTTANAIYVPPALQGQIDMQAGVLHAEERDYKTAFSYFYEAFEVYASLAGVGSAARGGRGAEERSAYRRLASANLKYLLMCKLMTQQVSEVPGLLQGKEALKFSGREVDAMRALTVAYEQRSVHELERVLRDYRDALGDDAIVHAHLRDLYNTLLEQNLTRIIEPYSRVQIAHVAARIDLPAEQVQSKLSQMILDGKLNGILDQGAGCLIVYEEEGANATYDSALETVKNMDAVVDTLMAKAAKLR